MQDQDDINEKMRAILVDWMVGVTLKFRLLPDTLQLSINIVDRYLAQKKTMRKNLQLVGVVSLIIASKFEVRHSVEFSFFFYAYVSYLLFLFFTLPIRKYTHQNVQIIYIYVTMPMTKRMC